MSVTADDFREMAERAMKLNDAAPAGPEKLFQDVDGEMKPLGELTAQGFRNQCSAKFVGPEELAEERRRLEQERHNRLEAARALGRVEPPMAPELMEECLKAIALSAFVGQAANGETFMAMAALHRELAEAAGLEALA